jgi:hypothetical protein
MELKEEGRFEMQGDESMYALQIMVERRTILCQPAFLLGRNAISGLKARDQLRHDTAIKTWLDVYWHTFARQSLAPDDVYASCLLHLC